MLLFFYENVAALCKDFEVSQTEIEATWEILIAGYWPGDYCGMAWVLLRNRSNGLLYEVNASHCSCNGIEGQFEPTTTSLAYLTSDHFQVMRDNDVPQEDKDAIKGAIAALGKE